MSAPARATLPAALPPAEVTVLLVILAYSFIPAAGGLVRILELGGGPALAPINPRALANPWTVAAHALASAVFCILGATQFLPGLRSRFPVAHRRAGRIVAIAGCTSAATGLWMTHAFVFPAALQGSLLCSVRTVLGIAMIGLIAWAVFTVRAGRVLAHRAAMLRAYAIGQGASTQALLGLTWMLLVGTELEGELRDGMMVLAWAFNALVAERLIGALGSSSPRRGAQATGSGGGTVPAGA